MDNNGRFNLLWTICWLLFIAFLCFLFRSMNPLWLLIIWFFRYIIKRRIIWEQEQLNLIIISNGRLAIVDYYNCWEEFKDWFMHIYNKEMSKISESDRIKSTYDISYSLEEIRQKICEIDEK